MLNNNKIKLKETFQLIFLLLTVYLIAYFPYLTGRSFFVFRDIGVDTYTQFVPGYQSMVDMLRSSTFQPWSFNHGLGQNIFNAVPDTILDPFNFLLYIFALLGIDVMRGILFVQIIKSIIGSILCYKYISMVFYSSKVSLLVAILYCFTGDTIIRNGWYHHTNDIVLYMLVLLAVEYYVQEQRMFLIPIASFAVVILRPIFYPYIFGLTFFGYATFRFLYLSKANGNGKSYLDFIIKGCIYFFLGIGIGCFFLMPAMYMALTSERGSTLGLNILKEFFSIKSTKEILTSLLSYFSPGIMGTGSNFLGYSNLLEAPTNYAGILCMVFSVYAIISEKDKKKKALFVILIGIPVLYSVFPIVHRIFNGPTPLFYKTSGPLLIVIRLVVASYGLNAYFNRDSVKPGVNGKKNCIVPIITILFFLLTLLTICDYFTYKIIDYKILLVIFIFLFIYLMFFLCEKHFSHKKSFLLLVVLVLCEATFSSFSIVNLNERATVTPEHISTESLYWDGSSDIIKTLQYQDNSFYRLQKSRIVSYNDSQYQGYYGTDIYDSFVYQNIADFFHYFSPLSMNEIARTHVPYNNDLINSLLSVKYIINNGMLDTETFHVYDLYETINEKMAYINHKQLPLGTFYTQYVTTEQLDPLSPASRAEQLFDSFLWQPDGNTNIAQKRSTDVIPRVKDDFILFDPDMVFSNDSNQWELFGENNDININFSNDNMCKNISYIDLDFVFYSPPDPNLNIYLNNNFQPIKTLALAPHINKYQVSIPVNGSLSHLILSFPTDFEISKNINYISITIREKDAEKYLLQKSQFIQEAPFLFKIDNDGIINGSIEAPSDGMLFLSIPYDKGWRINVNGIKILPEKINKGFIGIPLEEGRHEIILKYIPAYLYIGSIISIASLSCYIFLLKLQKKHIKEVEDE